MASRSLTALHAAIAVTLIGAAPASSADEPVRVPPVEVEGEAPRDEDPHPTAPAPSSDLSDPSALDSPAGPARELGRLPATHARESGGPGQPVTVSVRGADPSATLAVLDGVPLNSPFLGAADLAGLSLLPLDHVQVARGGLSAGWGSDAVGGVIEARTRSPLASPMTEASLMAGSFGTVRLKTSHVATAAAGRVGVLASAGMMSSAGDFPYRDTNGRARVRTHAGVAAIDGLVKVEAVPAARHSLSFSVEGFADDREVPGMEQFPSKTALQRDSRAVLSCSWSGPPPSGREGQSAASVHVRRLGLRYDDPAPPMGPPVSNVLVSWGVGGEVSAEERLLPWLALSAGAGATFDLGEVRRRTGRGYDARRTTLAGFVGGAIGREDRLLLLTATVRGQWWIEGSGSPWRPIVVPRGTLSSRPLPWLRLYADAGRAFRLPTLEELHFDAGFVRGNPHLAPEDALTFDAGLELGPFAGVALGLAYFETRAENLILFLPTGAFVIQAENSASAVARGVESRLSVRAGPVGLDASYTFLDARSSETGFAWPHRPRHRASGEVFGEAGPVRASVRVTGQTSFFLNRFETLSEEGRVTADVRVEVRPHPALMLAVDVLNVGDVRDAVDAMQQPLPGRALYGTFQVSL